MKCRENRLKLLRQCEQWLLQGFSLFPCAQGGSVVLQINRDSNDLFLLFPQPEEFIIKTDGQQQVSFWGTVCFFLDDHIRTVCFLPDIFSKM